jgi:hypothetical protein
MKSNLFGGLAIVVCVASCVSHAAAQEPPAQTFNGFRLVRPDDPKGLGLPPGVPRVVDTNGNVVGLSHQFTTKEYRHAAVMLILQEANRVAQELQLSEQLPIMESNLTEAGITPFGYNYIKKTIGSVSTSNYVYYVSQGNRFSNLGVANYTQTCWLLAEQSLPIKQLDYNGAYQLATQWLAAVSMDVSGLNRDCKVHVAVSPYWNGLARLGQKPGRKFVPIYYVWWTNPEKDANGFDGVASVELFLPTKKLLQLDFLTPKYILRKPLVFTNLDSLFPGTAKITIVTNPPVPRRAIGRPMAYPLH